MDATAAGPQSIIPGAGRDGGASLVRKRIAEPLRPRAEQAPCDIGLFDPARDQLKLL